MFIVIDPDYSSKLNPTKSKDTPLYNMNVPYIIARLIYKLNYLMDVVRIRAKIKFLGILIWMLPIRLTCIDINKEYLLRIER